MQIKPASLWLLALPFLPSPIPFPGLCKEPKIDLKFPGTFFRDRSGAGCEKVAARGRGKKPVADFTPGTEGSGRGTTEACLDCRAVTRTREGGGRPIGGSLRGILKRQESARTVSALPLADLGNGGSSRRGLTLACPELNRRLCFGQAAKLSTQTRWLSLALKRLPASDHWSL